ncbi:MAG: hypothetical protein KDH88_05255 [Chromatiales bacterium]|nr:hypothetical protein [Chromatiales bacterium]
MKLPPLNLAQILEGFREHSAAVLDLTDEFSDLHDDTAQSPALVAEAMARLVDVLQRIERDHSDRCGDLPFREPTRNDTLDVSELGEYGISLLAEMSAHATQLGLDDDARELQSLCFPMAVWIGRHGGEIRNLGQVVNAIAESAKQLHEPAELEHLSRCITEVIDAVAPKFRQDPDNPDPGRPWRALLISHGNIATRSYSPHLMEQAFELVVHYLPGDARSFFLEGMGQMDALDYPQHVRAVMQRFADQWCDRKTLH